MMMPNVQLFWQFSRFPVVRSYASDGVHIVELGERRSESSSRRGRSPSLIAWYSTAPAG